MQALGLIETAGYATAISAADVALKAANVELISIERVIGVSGLLGVTVQFSGDVAAVTSAVQAGKEEGERVGKVISAHVIPRAHDEVNEKLLSQFGRLETESDVAVREKTQTGRRKKNKTQTQDKKGKSKNQSVESSKREQPKVDKVQKDASEDTQTSTN